MNWHLITDKHPNFAVTLNRVIEECPPNTPPMLLLILSFMVHNIAMKVKGDWFSQLADLEKRLTLKQAGGRLPIVTNGKGQHQAS
jgi:hypothetical protein